jgi:hypothetical protein
MWNSFQMFRQNMSSFCQVSQKGDYIFLVVLSGRARKKIEIGDCKGFRTIVISRWRVLATFSVGFCFPRPLAYDFNRLPQLLTGPSLRQSWPHSQLRVVNEAVSDGLDALSQLKSALAECEMGVLGQIGAKSDGTGAGFVRNQKIMQKLKDFETLN